MNNLLNGDIADLATDIANVTSVSSAQMSSSDPDTCTATGTGGSNDSGC